MTADEVRGVVFQKAAIGGYKQSDVDLFLDEVAVCIETMTAKIRALEKAKFNNGNAGAAPVVPAPVEVQKPVEVKPEAKPEVKPEAPEAPAKSDSGVSDYGIQSLLLRAQRLAEQIEAEAHQVSEELLAKSADDAKDIIARADGEAEDTIEKANAILAEAERKEESINAAARAEAENIINEAVARSGQMLTSTREKLKSEQEMCDRLRNEFSQVKNVIVGFYEEQLRELNTIDIESSKQSVAEEEPVNEDKSQETVEFELEADKEADNEPETAENENSDNIADEKADNDTDKAPEINADEKPEDTSNDISSFSNQEPKTAEIKLDF